MQGDIKTKNTTRVIEAPLILVRALFLQHVNKKGHVIKKTK